MILKLLVVLSLCALLHQSEVLAKSKKYVVCYHGTWSTYRKAPGQFGVSNIDPFLCTHLMYAFFGIQESGVVRIIDPYLDLEDNGGRGNIRAFNALKLQNPTVKTLAAIGGWNEGSKKFSLVANDPGKRATFVTSVVQLLQRHGFDGVDLDWEYPLARHNLTNNDRENFITLLRELKEGLSPFGYILTAAVGSAEFRASASYIIPEMAQYLDIIHLMAYDLHGPWNDVIGINAPLHAGPSDRTAKERQLNVEAILKYWISKGAPRDKLVVGVPFYGRSFTLEDPQQHSPGAPHVGRGLAGQYSVEPGVIGYNELCEKMLTERWTSVWDADQMVPYAYKDRQWISYETPESIAIKTHYIVDNNLAGVMVWSLESDDFRGICGDRTFPLLKQINDVLYGPGQTATGMTSRTNQSSGEEDPAQSVESDDFRGICGDWTNTLLKQIYDILNGSGQMANSMTSHTKHPSSGEHPAQSVESDDFRGICSDWTKTLLKQIYDKLNASGQMAPDMTSHTKESSSGEDPVQSVESDDFHGNCDDQTYRLLKQIYDLIYRPVLMTTGMTSHTKQSSGDEDPAQFAKSDDFRDICGDQTYPLLKQIYDVLYRPGPTATGMTSHTEQSNGAEDPAIDLIAGHKVEHVCQEGNGYERDAEDCSKFYYCEDGFAHSFQCPAPLNFDLEELTCNFPQFVVC